MADRSAASALRASSLFDPKWYREQYPDVRLSGLDPAKHYLEFGARQGRDPGPRFSTQGYLERHPELAKDGINPLLHFLRSGAAIDDQPTPAGNERKPEGWDILTSSDLFDASWYLDNYPAVQLSAIDPHEHYLRVGSELGYDPGPKFSTQMYLSRHRSVREAGVNPLVHYLRYGHREGRAVDPSALAQPVTERADYKLIENSPLFDSSWYAAHYLDQRTPVIDPLSHFLEIGAWALNDPCAEFSTRAYLEAAPDVRARGMNPLVHYLKFGLAEGRKVSASHHGTAAFGRVVSQAHHALERLDAFDAGWYSERYDDVAASGLTPAEHYLEVGADLLRDPSPHFSTAGYATRNPDVIAAGRNPLLHYSGSGKAEHRPFTLDPEHAQPTHRPVHVPKAPRATPDARPDARVVAFYLPQFHPIPENDAWWGTGFTEWTGVIPAQPQFPGHYQPHVPGELGYYDLRDREVQRKQIDLAKRYGIDAFCFYFYWFDGVTLLETPLRQWLEDPSLDLPFMLCWANENWSRRWNGREDDVLIAQNHSPEDDLAFIEHAAEYLRDPRYTRIDGKPVLVVYRPSLLPDVAATAKRWRAWCRDNGVGEIYLAYTTSFDRLDPETIGFDAAVEFAPNNMATPDITQNRPKYGGFAGRMYDWPQLVSRSHAYPPSEHRVFRGVNPSWDNTPRRGSNAGILAGSTPGQFTRWTANAIRETLRTREADDDGLLFVNAWNEWGEGAHLEPDEAYGYAWLESVRVALASTAPATAVTAESDVAFVIDLTSTSLPSDLPAWILELEKSGSLWVLIDGSDEDAAVIPTPLDGFTHLVRAPHGVGMLGLLQALPEMTAAGFDLVYRIDDEAPPLTELRQLVTRFAHDSRLGLVRMGGERVVGSLESYASQVATRLGLEPGEIGSLSYATGGAFAARLSALAPIAALAFDDEDVLMTGSRYVPFLDSVLDASLTASAAACNARVQATPAVKKAPQRPSVLIVSHDLHPHGAQRLALAMGAGFRDSGFDVRFIALEGGRLENEFRQVGQVDIVGVAPGDIRTTRKLLRSIAGGGTRAAIVNTTVAAPLIPLLKAEGFSVVSLVHELPGVLGEMALHRSAQYVSELADVAVFPSELVRDRFQGFVGSDHPDNSVIRHQGEYLALDDRADGATVREALGIASDAPVILAVGYGDHRKGIDLFGEVVANVLAVDPTAHAIWVGHLGQDGAYGEALQAIEQADVADRVHFPGLVDARQIRDYYAAAAVMLVPSREDPYPSTVIEAMGSAVPIFAFEGSCGNEELLRRGAGVLVPAFDTSAMADEVSAILGDPERAAAIGEFGREIRNTEFNFNSYLFDLLDYAGLTYPRVSVVVPNYNYARILPERLKSIDNQTHPIFEVIVLDDSSTDFSDELIRQYAKAHPMRVRYLPNDSNSGSVFKQWRKGVDAARGDFVWIAEADDLADPEFLSSTIPAFTDPRVVISYAQSRAIDDRGRVTMPDYLPYVADLDDQRWRTSYVADGLDEIRAGMYVKNTIPNVSAVTFRKAELLDVLQESHQDIISLRNAGDWLVYLRVLERGSIAFTATPLSSHRRHAHSVTISSFDEAQLLEIRTIQESTIRRHRLGEAETGIATRYAQTLYQQFGLAHDKAPRVDDSPAVGTQAVESAATQLTSRRIGVVSIPRRLPVGARDSFPDLYGAIGRNTGNYMFTEAMFRQLQGQVEPIGFGFDPEVVNSEFDAVVIPAANWLNESSDWTFLVEKIERLTVPVIMIGVGLQVSNESSAEVRVHESALRLVRAVAERSTSISTRGDFTSDWLRKQGFREFVTTGCPSTYMKQVALSDGDGDGLVLQSTRYGATRSFAAANGLNEQLFRLAAQHDIDMLYQSEPEELEALLLAAGAASLDKLADGLLADTYGLKSDADARAYVARHGQAFVELDSWSRWIATKSGQFGTRLHGAILALNSGVPAVLAPHDSRTAEVARYAHIPTFNFDREQEITLSIVEEAILNAETADYYATRRVNQAVYQDFLRANGLSPRDTGFND